MKYSNEDKCYLARIILEATTPMRIGSGRKSVKTDALINRDVNGLPYIPATTLMGLLRHHIADEATVRRIMGYQEAVEGQGSRLALTEARMLDSNGKPVEGLHCMKEIEDDAFLSNFSQMPIRQHVRIDGRGTAEHQGKFDEEIIPVGTRFCFEMELRADDCGEADFHLLLDTLQSQAFRVGGGSRKGFGEIQVVRIGYRKLDFAQHDDLMAYLGKENRLDCEWDGFTLMPLGKVASPGVIGYELQLTPVDFVLFASGFGNDAADMTYVRESHVTGWDSGKAGWTDSERTLVIPASSVKGAVAHRTAFYYNLLTGHTAELANAEPAVPNAAVVTLFGSAGTSGSKDRKRGKVLFSDVVEALDIPDKGKVMNHVSLDRFTGGAVDGALFAEETLYLKNHRVLFKVQVEANLLQHPDGAMMLRALEEALKDVCRCRLPLGGGVNRGNGTFKGKLMKNGETVYEHQ